MSNNKFYAVQGIRLDTRMPQTIKTFDNAEDARLYALQMRMLGKKYWYNIKTKPMIRNNIKWR